MRWDKHGQTTDINKGEIQQFMGRHPYSSYQNQFYYNNLGMVK